MTADRPATEPRLFICDCCGEQHWLPEAAQGGAPPPGGWKTPGDPSIDGTDFDWSKGAAPRAERLVPIRDVLDYFLPFIESDFAAKESQERIDQRVKTAQALAPEGAAPRADTDTALRTANVLWSALNDRLEPEKRIGYSRLFEQMYGWMLDRTAPRAEGLNALSDALVAAEDEGYLTLADHMSAREVAARLSRPSDEVKP